MFLGLSTWSVLELGLLPACVTCVDLHASTWAFHTVDLASFCKFTVLQTLTIYPFGDDPEYQLAIGNRFLLNAMRTILISLPLSSWPLKYTMAEFQTACRSGII